MNGIWYNDMVYGALHLKFTTTKNDLFQLSKNKVSFVNTTKLAYSNPGTRWCANKINIMLI